MVTMILMQTVSKKSVLILQETKKKEKEWIFPSLVMKKRQSQTKDSQNSKVLANGNVFDFFLACTKFSSI